MSKEHAVCVCTSDSAMLGDMCLLAAIIKDGHIYKHPKSLTNLVNMCDKDAPPQKKSALLAFSVMTN